MPIALGLYALCGLLFLAWALQHCRLHWGLFVTGPFVVASWPYWLWRQLRFLRHHNRIVRVEPRR